MPDPAQNPAVNAPPPTGAPLPKPQPAPPPAVRARALPRPSGEEKPFAKGFGTGVGIALGAGAVALALLVVSIVGFGLVGLVSGGSNQQLLTTHVWGPSNAKNTVLALNITGPIDGAAGGTMFTTGTYGYEIADQLDALSTEDYAGVVLLMDTPGGSIYGSRAIADAVIRYQERTGNKVVAYVQSMSASGGMYAMAPADLIISDHGTFIGSIGVIFGPFSHFKQVTGLTGTILESGVQTSGGVTQEYLTAGTGKDFGNPFREMTELERQTYTEGMLSEYEQFVSFVAEHRGLSAETITDELGAFMFDPETAVQKGLADQVLGRPDAFRAAATEFGVDPDDTKLVSPTMPGTLSQLLGVEARVPGHNIPLSRAEQVSATSQLCIGAPNVLAFAGDFAEVCG